MNKITIIKNKSKGIRFNGLNIIMRNIHHGIHDVSSSQKYGNNFSFFKENKMKSGMSIPFF